ncbi:MAG: GumC family protein [Desulfuromonadales bacterium]
MEQQRIELIRYFEILVNRRRFIFCITAAAFVLAVIISLLLPKSYQATALVLPPVESGGRMSALLGQFGGSGFADLLPGQSGGPDLYVGLLETGAVRDAIIDRFNLLEEEEDLTREALYRQFDRTVSVEAGRKDGIISIAVEDRDPKRAAEMANAFVVALEELVARINSGSAGKDRDFFETRLAEAQTDLAKSEEALKAFLARNQAIDVVEQGKATIEAAGRLYAELGEMEVRLAILRQSMTESNSEVRAVKGAIENLKKQIADLERGTDGADGGAIPAVGAIPALGQEYVSLTREFKTREAVVEMLTRQYEIARLGESKTLSGIKLVQSAHVPEKKFKPKRALIVFFSSYVAFVVSVLLAFVLERIEQLPVEKRERWRRLSRQLFGRR